MSSQKLPLRFRYWLLYFDDTLLARKWTAGGPVGPVGVVVHRVFAREISVFERELVPTRSQVMMESTAMEKVQRGMIAWVSLSTLSFSSLSYDILSYIRDGEVSNLIENIANFPWANIVNELQLSSLSFSEKRVNPAIVLVDSKERKLQN